METFATKVATDKMKTTNHLRHIICGNAQQPQPGTGHTVCFFKNRMRQKGLFTVHKKSALQSFGFAEISRQSNISL